MIFKRLTYKDFKKYFSNNLAKKEKHTFEKRMMQDDFESDAYDGLSSLTEDELESDITALKNQLKEKTISNKRIIPVWFKYAASVIVLIGLSLMFYIIDFSREDMYKEGQITQETEDLSKSSDEKLVKEQPIFINEESEEPAIESEKKLETIAVETKKKEVSKGAKLTEETKQISTQKRTVQSEPVSEKITEVQEMEMLSDKSEDVYEETTEVAATSAGVVAENIDEVSIEVMEDVAEMADENQFAGDAEEEMAIKDFPERALSQVIKNEENKKENLITYRTISGIVIDENDEAIPFANVLIEGTSIGAVADIDGKFSFVVTEDIEVEKLVVSYVGYKTKTFLIEEDSNNVLLVEPGLMAMEEVVVTEYKENEKGRNVFTRKKDKTSINESDIVEENNFKEYILDHLNYTTLKDFKGSNTVKFSFQLNENGNCQNFEFEEFPDSVFVREITYILENGPNWKPEIKNGNSIESRIKINISIEVH